MQLRNHQFGTGGFAIVFDEKLFVILFIIIKDFSKFFADFLKAIALCCQKHISNDYLLRILKRFLSLVEIAFVVSRISKIASMSSELSVPKYSPLFNVSNDMANNTPQST